MDAHHLRLLFRALLKTSLASPLILGAGCGPDLSDYEPQKCETPLVSGLAPSVIPDVVQLRAFSDFGWSEPEKHHVLASEGLACATAEDAQACEAALEALAPDAGFRKQCYDLCTSHYLATTRGDSVEAVTTLEGLRGFLGQIDTRQEALLMVFAQGYDLTCGDVKRTGVRENPTGGFDVIATTGHTCGRGTAVLQHQLHVTKEGEVREESQRVLERGNANCIVGRRPAGLRDEAVAVARSSSGSGALGRHFEQMARLEAAAVHAFLRLRSELQLHGAPDALGRDAVVSAVEEVGHAQTARRLALRHGARPRSPEVSALPLRSLFEVALDNRVEGCVRETYGALVAHHQAIHADSAEVRSVMARIAAEETAHAALSWAVDAWARTRLDRRDRAELDRQARRAAEALQREAAEHVAPELVAGAGLPDAEKAEALVESLTRELRAAA